MSVVDASKILEEALAERGDYDLSYEDDLAYDLRNLAAFDAHPLDLKVELEDGGRIVVDEDAILQAATKNVSLLLGRLGRLPRETIGDVNVVVLPAAGSKGVTVLPRAEHLPTPKLKTRWEEFAERKGIVKRKKEHLVWDEMAGDWKPTYGKNRRTDNVEELAPMLPDNPNSEEDPYSAAIRKRKEKVTREKKNMVGNRRRANRKGVPAGKR